MAGAGAASPQGELPRQERPMVGGGALIRGACQVVAAVAPRERIGVAQLGEHAQMVLGHVVIVAGDRTRAVAPIIVVEHGDALHALR